MLFVSNMREVLNIGTREKNTVQYDVTLLTDHDIYLFKEGIHFRLYDKLGAHILSSGGTDGTHFAVWAPNARMVSVIGDLNGWTRSAHPLKVREDSSGIW